MVHFITCFLEAGNRRILWKCILHTLLRNSLESVLWPISIMQGKKLYTIAQNIWFLFPREGLKNMVLSFITFFTPPLFQIHIYTIPIHGHILSANDCNCMNPYYISYWIKVLLLIINQTSIKNWLNIYMDLVAKTVSDSPGC